MDEALAEAPQLIDLHSARARFLKHAGDLRGAAASAVAAQDLEKSDRHAAAWAAALACTLCSPLSRNTWLGQADSNASLRCSSLS